MELLAVAVLLAVMETAAVETAAVAVIETDRTFTATMTAEVAKVEKVEKVETKVVVRQTPQSLWAACPIIPQRTRCIENFQRLARWLVSESSWIRRLASPKASDLSTLGRHRMPIMQFLA